MSKAFNTIIAQFSILFCTACSLVPRLLCQGGGKRAWYTLFAHAPSSLVTCILFCYTKINGNFCLPAERPHCRIILPVRHFRAVLKSENSVCITLYKMIGKLQVAMSIYLWVKALYKFCTT